MKKNYLIFALIFWSAIKLHASCCSQTGAGGAGRLLAHERALVEFSSKANYTFGGFNGQSRFSFGHEPNLPYLSFEQNLHIMARVVDYFMPFIHLPVIIKKSDAAAGGGPADIVLGARSNLLSGLDYWPNIALVNGVKAPTGQKSSNTKASEDITSTGEWQGFLGLILEKEWAPVTYGLSYSLLIDSWRFGHAISLSASFLLHENGILTLSVLPTFYGDISFNGQRLLGSNQRKLTLGANYAFKFHSKLSLIINAGSDIPIAYLGRDHSSDMSLKLALRWGVF